MGVVSGGERRFAPPNPTLPAAATMPTFPAYWPEALAALAAADPRLATQVASLRPTQGWAAQDTALATLMRAIVGQQISTRAAETVWQRVRAVLPVDFEAADVLTLPPDALRTAGLSARKVAYVQDLAQHFASGQLDPRQFATQDDATLIATLTAVKGIGVWTAEMFLIFHLHRPDVWPVDDLGLQRAVARLYFDGNRPSPAALRAWGARFAPWRTVATWVLWRSVAQGESA